MRPGFWPIYKREIKTYLQSVSTHVVFGLMFLVVGTFYHQIVVDFVNDSAMAGAGGPFAGPTEAPNVTVTVIQGVFELLAGMILFTVPILSMRLVAAERSAGTFEVLVTCPIGDWSILFGKYLALVTVGFAIVALSAVYPVTTYFVGRGQIEIEWPIVASCALGLLLMFATYAAFGVMASSFTESQVTAAIVTLVGLLLWNTLAEFDLPGPATARILDELSAARHTERFIEGAVAASDLAFYGLASFFCLFIAARTLEARRWRI